MRGRRTSSRVQEKSGKLRSPHTSSAREHEGDDYPLDGIAPDDLPVRDIRGDEDEGYSPEGAGAEARDESRQDQADARALAVDSFEVMSAASEIVPSPPASSDHQPTRESSIPARGMGTEVTKRPAQHTLPGLEPATLSGQEQVPKRGTRSGRSPLLSDRRPLKVAQMELWPQTKGSDPET